MTKEELLRARHLRNELEAISRSLTHPKSTYVAAFYKDYTSGYGVPRIETGEDGGRSERIRLETSLEHKRVELRRAIVRIQEFIDSIEDAETRVILQSYYIAGMTQQEIADEIHVDQKTVSNRLQKFWEQQKNTRQ